MATPRYSKNWNLPGLQEVVGHGLARPPSKIGAGQVELGVYLAPVSPQDGYSFRPGLVPERRWFGAGELALYPIGSRWQDGSLKGTRVINETCRTSGTVVSATAMIGLADWNGCKGIPPFPVSPDMDRCFLIELAGGRTTLVALPVAEALRAFFGRTSDLLLHMFCGRDPVGRRSFQMPEAIEGAPGDDVVIRFDRIPSRQEALVATMILTDPVVGTSFFGVRTGITTHRGWNGGEGVPIETSCPFPPGVELGLEGRWLGRTTASGTKRLFLATRIVSISYMPRFKTLAARFPSVTSDGEAPPSEGSVLIGPIKTVIMNSARDPAGGRSPLEIATPGATVHMLGGVGFRLLPDEPTSVAPPPNFLVEDEKDAASGSTGDAVPGGDRDSRRVKVVDRDDFDGIDPSLELISRTDAAIRLLCREPGWKEVWRKPHPGRIAGGLMVLLVCLEVEGVGIAVCDGGLDRGKPRSVGIIRKKDCGLLTMADGPALELLIADRDAHWLRRPGEKEKGIWRLRGLYRDTAPRKPDGKAATFVDRLRAAIVSHTA